METEEGIDTIVKGTGSRDPFSSSDNCTVPIRQLRPKGLSSSMERERGRGAERGKLAEPVPGSKGRQTRARTTEGKQVTLD